MIHDILGVQKSTVKNVVNLNERLKATKPLRKKVSSGIAREVLQLCGDSLTSLPIQTQTTEGFSNRRTADITHWVWCRFNNSAHSSTKGIHLHHWHPLADATEEQKEDHGCCEYVATSDYAPSAFNKKAQVVRYSPSLYAKLIAVSYDQHQKA